MVHSRYKLLRANDPTIGEINIICLSLSLSLYFLGPRRGAKQKNPPESIMDTGGLILYRVAANLHGIDNFIHHRTWAHGIFYQCVIRIVIAADINRASLPTDQDIKDSRFFFL